MNRQAQFSACHICGSEDYVWGDVYGYGSIKERFAAKSVSGFSKFFGQGFENVVARKCTNCGNIQTFSVEIGHNSRKKKDDEYFY